MRAEQVSVPVAFHGEGPVWWPDDGSSAAGTLRYVDMTAGRILTQRDGAVETMSVPSRVAAAFRPRASGGIAVLTEHGVHVSADATGGEWSSAAEILHDPAIRFNDGGCAPDGAFYIGSMRYDQAKGGARLYRLGPDGAISVVLPAVTVSNGIAWTVEGDRAYYNDTPTRTTWVFDWSPERGLHQRRPHHVLGEDDPAGGPDGLCVDAFGNVWTAIYGGSRVEARDPGGHVVERIDLPVTNVTACTFGDADLGTLYITTTRENVPDGEQPEAGALFRTRPGVTGQPAVPFGA